MMANRTTTHAGFDPAATRRQIQALGRRLSLETLAASQRLYARHHDQEPYADLRLVRDLSYGPDERHRLDVFYSEPAPGPRPALLFVHGGGYVGGDKRRAGSPFNDHVGAWAARNGMVGVNMTHRLAPMHPWPAGPEDVAAAVSWLRTNAAEHGIDPRRIFLFGQSAGATHAAAYIGHPEFHGADSHGLAGAILLSGVYDLTAAEQKNIVASYFGSDPAHYAERSSVQGVAASDLPLMVSVGELEPSHFERQTLLLATAICARRRHLPRILQLAGHNHYSGLLHLGLSADALGPGILGFMGDCELLAGTNPPAS